MGIFGLSAWSYLYALGAGALITLAFSLILKFHFKVKSFPLWYLGLQVLGFSFLPYFYKEAKIKHEDKMRSILLGYGPSYGYALDAVGLESINENTDPNDTIYLKIIELQKKWLLENPAVSDIYTFSKNSKGQTILLVDSETDYNRDGKFEGDTESRTPIGQSYEEDADAIAQAFMGNQYFQDEPVTDEWGVWISSYTPIQNKKGQVYALLGIDFPAAKYQAMLAESYREVFAICLTLLFLLNISFTIVRVVSSHLQIELTLQKDLNASRARAQETSRLVALGEMASGVAHEVNNPVAIIVGKTEQLLSMIEDNNVEPVKFKDSLEKILNMTDRISKIVRGLRVFSQDSSQDPYAIMPISKVVSDACTMVQEKFRSLGVSLSIDLPEHQHIRCRSVEISQVLLNLLSNSIDAVKDLPQKWVKINSEIQDSRILLYVTDSGMGIPKQIADKLMTPFFTTKEVGKGTGLGLSTSAGILMAHGGRLYLNQDHKHTQFVLEFPVAISSSQDDGKKAA